MWFASFRGAFAVYLMCESGGRQNVPVSIQNLAATFSALSRSLNTATHGHVSWSVDSTGIAIVRLDAPNKKVNTLGVEMSADIAETFEKIEADDSARAVVLISSKANDFVAGADISM